MKDFNKVCLSGRLTKDPEVRKTGNNISVLNVTIAAKRRIKNQQGEYDVDFIDVTVWRSGADFLAQYAGKGDKIGVEGRIETQTYQNDKGENVKKVFITADDVSILQKKASHIQQQEEKAQTVKTRQNKQPTMNGQPLDTNGAFDTDPNGLGISTDDLPFY